MPTRAAAKRDAAALQDTLAASLSSPPATSISATDIATASKSSTSATANRKRHPPKAKKALDLDVLPHGLGKKGDLLEDDNADEKIPAGISPPPTKKRAGMPKLSTPASPRVSNSIDPLVSELLEKESKKRGRKSKDVKEESDDGLDDETFTDVKPKPKRAAPEKKSVDTSSEVVATGNELVAATKKVRKGKAHPYGLTPGKSPFPAHVQPTHEACEEVVQLLFTVHARTKEEQKKFRPPEKIPAPSMDVAGCGEVPDLLDAILRTLLSAATSSNNSNLAMKGLKNKFGLRSDANGNAWLNWDAVRQADVGTIKEAIKSGGLAAMKAKNIKAILDKVYEQNCGRRDALLKEKETGEVANMPGVKQESQQVKDVEITHADNNFLNMDYIFELSTNEAMDEMTKLPGIGVKTASCVILFCMKRPSFAVDTHVWRHCKMLGWVPNNANRDKTFSHCEVRVPDSLKYTLHQLFLAHGKRCGRCKANGSTEEWENTVCPIEHLVTRPERKRGSHKMGGKKRKRGEDDSEEEEMIEEFSDSDE